MIVELIVSRGLGLLIDGHKPARKGWGYGETPHDGPPYTSFIDLRQGLRGPRLGDEDDQPLPVGPHQVLGILTTIPLDDVCRGENGPFPEMLLQLSGDPTIEHVPLYVTHWATGRWDNEESYDVPVQLTDGNWRDIDEITLYLRLNSEKPAGPPVQLLPE